MGISHYNKIENGQREASVELLDKLAKLYGVSIDAIVHMEGEVPKEIVMEDKTTSEQMRLIQELDEKDKGIIFSMIDIMLTKKKFKGFFPEKRCCTIKQKARHYRTFCYFILRVFKDLSKSSFFSFGTLSYPILTFPILISFQNSDLLFIPDNSKVSGKTVT